MIGSGSLMYLDDVRRPLSSQSGNMRGSWEDCDVVMREVWQYDLLIVREVSGKNLCQERPVMRTKFRNS